MPASSSSDPGFCIIDRRTPAAPPEFADITASPPAMRLEVRGGNIVERNVPLLRGPATETDPTGTGLVVDAHGICAPKGCDGGPVRTQPFQGACLSTK